MSYQTSCSFCGEVLRPVLDLGNHPHSDYFPKDRKVALKTYPLALTRCKSCGLFQTDYHLSSEDMFNHDYIYDSSINKSGRYHWKEFSNDLHERININLKKGNIPRSLDIGSNSGELVSAFSLKGWEALGVEPSEQPHRIALNKGRPSLKKFFNPKILNELKYEDYDLITFTNSFPHIPSPVDTLNLAHRLINKKTGIICIESPSSEIMLKEGQYDQIYHQHMTYLDPISMSELCLNMDLNLFETTSSSYHNGSTRYYISHKDSVYKTSTKLKEYIDNNKKNFLSTKIEDEFRRKCLLSRKAIRRFVEKANYDKKKIGCVSAPAKGNTILNFCGLSSHDLPFTTEANQLKIGRYTPISNIKIYSDKELVKFDPDLLIVLAWNFIDVISKSVSDYVPKAKFINPLKIE